MTRVNLTLLSLLSVAWAAPSPGYGPAHLPYGPGPVKPSGGVPTGGFPSGTGSPIPESSSAPFPAGNSTSGAATGTGTGVGTGAPTTIYQTLTVVPVPVSSGQLTLPFPSEAPSSVSSSPAETGGNGNSPIGGSSGECGPATVTVTKANTVTVTVAPIPVTSQASESPVAASSAAPVSSAPYGNGTSTAPIGTGTGTGASNTVASTVAPIYPPISSSSPHHGYHHLSLHKPHPVPLAPVKAEAPAPVKEEAPAPAPVKEETPAPAPEKVPAPVKEETPGNGAYSPIAAAKASQPESIPESKTESKPESTPESTPKTGPVSATSGTKRGLVYNSASLTSAFEKGPISWCYNWDSAPGGEIPSNFDYVPMMWGPIPVHTSNWNQNADSALSKGSTHLLAFNEPDLASQSNLTPDEAVSAWGEYMQPYAGKAKLGAPSVCNGDDDKTDAESNIGLHWLNKFLAQCSSCTIDFIPIHWYGEANDEGVADFKNHIKLACESAGSLPLWVTEMKADGDDAAQESFMQQVLPFLEAQTQVERYAYFEVDGILADSSGLTPLGEMYAS